MATILKPDSTVTYTIGNEELTIKRKIIPDSLKATKDVCSWVKKGENMKPCAKLNDGTGKPRGITVHNTENITTSADTTPAEQYTRATYSGNMGGVVVHYYVYENDIWQMLENNERGWHSTDGRTRISAKSGATYSTICGNTDTIAIECIGNNSKSEDTTAKLVAYLCKTYGLKPVEDVYTHHYFYAKKNCPIYIIGHWDKFLSTVKSYYNGGKATTTDKSESKTATATTTSTTTTAKSDTTSNSSSDSFQVKVIYKSGLNIRKTANSLSKKVGEIPYGGVYTITKTSSNGTWGYLKSGAGWICIKSTYVKKV